MADKAEVVIVGGGVIGCSILYHLAARGVSDALLLEKDTLASGSTSRSQAILRMHYSNAVTTLLAWKSLEVFRNFQEITGVPSGYVRCGYFRIVGPEDRQALEENVALQRSLGVDARVVSPEEVREISPAVRAQEGEAIAYEPPSGYADPYSVTMGFARRARDLGARIETGRRVTAIRTQGGRVVAVETDKGRVDAATVVVAAGPWSRPLLASVGVDVPLETVRHQVVILWRPVDRLPEHPVISDGVYGYSARPDVNNVSLVGLREDPSPGPDEFNQGVDMEVVAEAMTGVARRMPAMEEAAYRGGWSGLFTCTPDWHPVLDRVEDIQGLYCAVGFSGHGFKLSPMVGATMAELITEGRATTVDISQLSLARFREGRLMPTRYAMRVMA